MKRELRWRGANSISNTSPCCYYIHNNILNLPYATIGFGLAGDIEDKLIKKTFTYRKWIFMA
jgi:hypothetical protein